MSPRLGCSGRSVARCALVGDETAFGGLEVLRVVEAAERFAPAEHTVGEVLGWAGWRERSERE